MRTISQKKFDETIITLGDSKFKTLDAMGQLADSLELTNLFNDNEIPILIMRLHDSAEAIQEVLNAIDRRQRARAKGLDLRK